MLIVLSIRYTLYCGIDWEGFHSYKMDHPMLRPISCEWRNSVTLTVRKGVVVADIDTQCCWDRLEFLISVFHSCLDFECIRTFIMKTHNSLVPSRDFSLKFGDKYRTENVNFIFDLRQLAGQALKTKQPRLRMVPEFSRVKVPERGTRGSAGSDIFTVQDEVIPAKVNCLMKHFTRC